MSEQHAGAFRVQKVAVIGAGVAGRAFALRCARAGFGVVLEDVMPSKLRRAQDEYTEATGGAESRLFYASTVEDAVSDADLVVDFVPDELESKLEIFSLLDRMAPPRTVLCTPTQALSITDLASCTYRADRCIAVRWLSESAVELVQTTLTSNIARDQATGVFRELGFDVEVHLDDHETMLTSHL